MPEPAWVKILTDLLPFVGALAAFLFGKATKGAVNQAVLDGLCKRADALEAWQNSVVGTLASHNTLHGGYRDELARIATQLTELNAQVARLGGAFDGKARGDRHGG